MKHTKFYFLFSIFVILASFNASGQVLSPEKTPKPNKPFNAEFCGTDLIHNQKMKNDPTYKMRHLKSREAIKKISSQTFKKAAGGITQIPVVVHVMHKGESVGTGTNISDEDVKRGIKYLNNYWRKVNASPGFGDGVDMKIEFSLAVQDQNGNCTNGIDRVNMSGVPAYVSDGISTSGGSGLPDYEGGGAINSLKEYSIWNPTKYYNVWIVDEINNRNCFSGGSYTAGYAYYSSAHGQPYDGSVVLICSYLSESDVTWAHEMGHAFNLPHTFDGDDSNNDGVGDVCGDDGIADTPEHIRTASISPSIYFSCNNADANACDPTFNKVINPDNGFIRNSGTHQDHMHNYMDYTGCSTEFTGGQRAVCTTALTTDRASYLTSTALTPATPATVFFTSSATNACLGGTINFYDESSCTPNTYTNAAYTGITFLWTFNNNVNPAITSTLQNPSITFANSGSYDVSLAVTNTQGTTSLQKLGNITVTAATATCTTFTSFNNNGNYGRGVTKVVFNTINNTTTTFIPANATNDFICTKNTTVFAGTANNLTVNYKSASGSTQFLEVWIDWDNSGSFQTSNSNGVNERVLQNNIAANATGSPTISITPPATAVLNSLLRMRVVSESGKAPTVCGNGSVQRADDYGILVKPACAPPTAVITNNSGTSVLTCIAPSINLTASGGASYSWNNNKGITPTIAVTQPGTYIVTVTSASGCTDTETIVITENKPAPTIVITNNTGSAAITCSISSISVTASGGTSYSWDNGLGTNAIATITSPGTYTVTATGANGCTATKSVVITDGKGAPTCAVSSFNNGGNYGCGVTKVVFNTINKTTPTDIPANATNNFVCSDQTTLSFSTAYNLSVTFKALANYTHYLDVWIDWNNNGVFETSNSNGVNEKVLSNTIAAGATATPSISITPPASATLNTLLRMRVVTDADSAPTVCGSGFVKRADDYGVIVANPTTIWNGSAWSAAVPTTITNAIIDGTYNTNVGGVQIPFSANKLTVNTGKSFTINSGTNITVQNEVINNGSLVLENNANLIQINNVTNTGIITVNRNGSALKRLDYTLWSSPVTGTQTLAAFSPLTSQTPNRFYNYNSALGTNGLYTSIAATATFAKGAGYLIRMPHTNPLSGYDAGTASLSYAGVFTGVPNNGQVPVTLNYTDAAHAYNLVGNPYPSVIDATTFINANTASIEGTLYFWRKTNAALGSAYATYTLGGGTAVTPTSPTPNGKIQLGQGFFVQAKNAGLVPNFFTNAMREAAPTSTQIFKTSQEEVKDRVWLSLSNPTGVFSQTLVAYLPEATTGVDKYDGKYINDSPIAFSSGINNEEYTIQSRPTFSTNDEVSLYFKTNLASNYTIAIDNAEGKLAQNQAIYLLDTTTGIETNLKTSSYNFNSESGMYNNRFTLKYQKTLDLVTPTFDENTVTVFKKNKNLHVSSPKIAIISVQVFDIQGKLIAERKNVNSNTLTIENIKIQDQVMIVKVIGENGKIVNKKIID